MPRTPGRGMGKSFSATTHRFPTPICQVKPLISRETWLFRPAPAIRPPGLNVPERIELSWTMSAPRITVDGATRPLRRPSPFRNPHPALSLVGGNRSSCPEADTHDHPHERRDRVHSGYSRIARPAIPLTRKWTFTDRIPAGPADVQPLQNARNGGYHAFVAAKLVVHRGNAGSAANCSR